MNELGSTKNVHCTLRAGDVPAILYFVAHTWFVVGGGVNVFHERGLRCLFYRSVKKARVSIKSFVAIAFVMSSLSYLYGSRAGFTQLQTFLPTYSYRAARSS